MLLNCGVGEDSWESLGLQGDPTSPSSRKSVLNIHWKDWWWSWNSNTLATWCKELTHLKRPWCWERVRAGGEGDDRGWDGWIPLPTQWTWVWVNSRSWWWTVRRHIRCYWQNRGTALNPLPLLHRHGPGTKELGFVILICFFLSLAELTEENIKVLIVFERSMRRHKDFCSCAQRIIHKVNHWHLFKDFYKKMFQGEHTGRSLRPWEGFLSEAHLLLNSGLRNN